MTTDDDGGTKVVASAEPDDLQSEMAHELTHTLGVDAIAIIAFTRGTDGLRISFRMSCDTDVNDNEAMAAVAQGVRQGCANLSKGLRERFVERTMAPGEVRYGFVVDADDVVDGDPDPGKAH